MFCEIDISPNVSRRAYHKFPICAARPSEENSSSSLYCRLSLSSLFLSLSFLFSLVSTFCTGQDMHCSQIFVCNSIYAAERKRIAFRNAFETRRKPEYKAHWRYRARYHDEWRERPLRTICDVNSDSLALGRFYILRY